MSHIWGVPKCTHKDCEFLLCIHTNLNQRPFLPKKRTYFYNLVLYRAPQTVPSFYFLHMNEFQLIVILMATNKFIQRIWNSHYLYIDKFYLIDILPQQQKKQRIKCHHLSYIQMHHVTILILHLSPSHPLQSYLLSFLLSHLIIDLYLITCHYLLETI